MRCGLGVWCFPIYSYAQGTASKAVSTDFTNVNTVLYNADNRNERPGDVSRQLDDNWGAIYNRFNVQASARGFRIAARVDGAWFYTAQSPVRVGLNLLDIERRGNNRHNTPYSSEDADYFVNKFFEAGVDRNTRFTDWLYPAKYTLSYGTPDYEATVGDFYAQFGRGLVLNVRKQDELSSDTTIRGLRLEGKTRFDAWRLKLNALAGNLNPLRLDAASGRFLGVSNRTLSSWDTVTEAGMPRVVNSDFVANPAPTLLPDSVIGTEVELKHRLARLSLQGAYIRRGCHETPNGCVGLGSDLTRSARTATQGGIALDVPNVASIASVYVEYAHQNLELDGPSEPHGGDALYLAANLNNNRVTTTLEAKHVRGYQLVGAAIDPGRTPEFTPIIYNMVPTTHPIWNDTQFENFGACVTGGRVRTDVQARPDWNLNAQVGYYQTWGEVGPAQCEPTEQNRNRVWDFAQGVETTSNGGKSSAQVLLGTRLDDSATPRVDAVGTESTVFYREQYLRYDIVQWIGGQSSVQLTGWHRRRHQVLGGPDVPWLSGITTTGLQLGPSWNVTVGLEYDQNPAFPATYVSGQLRYNVSPSNNVSLFVGQQRGGLRCVSGVCRMFPPFEGARLESTFRF
jgi:hypothetical protein